MTGGVKTRDFQQVFEVLTASLLTFTFSTGQIADAPDRLISGHGVELINDGRVFLLFASLNGLGYSNETLMNGPPLEAPVYHRLRIVTRDALRKVAKKGKLKTLKDLFDSRPQSIDSYLHLILSHNRTLTSPSTEVSKQAKALSEAVSSLRTLSENPEVVALVDAIAFEQREHAKTLMQMLEKDFTATEKYLALDRLVAPTSVSVIPNPLDSHNTVREIKIGDKTIFVTGPGHNAIRSALIEASLLPLVTKWVGDNWAYARKLKRHWRGLKASKRITKRYGDGQAYLVETLTRVLVYRAGLHKGESKLDAEDFIEHERKKGLRWTRACLKAVDKFDAKISFETQFPDIIKTIAP